jgi:hypothetical protein
MNNKYPDYFFFKKGCKSCTALLRSINALGLLPYFKLICIDGRENEIPKYVTYVPTLVINQLGRPGIFIADNAFIWVNNIRNLQRNRIVNMQKQINGNSNKIDFIGDEYKGLSDNYSLINEDTFQPKSYFKWKGEDNKENMIVTAEEQDKINKNEIRKMITDIDNDRKNEYTEFEKIQFDKLKKILN